VFHLSNPLEDGLAIDVEATYRRYGPMVLRRCRALLRNEEAAVDAMQDTFVRLLRYSARLTDQGLSSLLYRMATNVCLNRIRSTKRHPEDRDDALLLRIAAAPEDGLGPARLMLQRIFRDQSESTRAMAVMHLLDGMTLQEVADETGLSVSGVRKRLRTLKAHVAELEGV
jgi:RNA polymerase sigma factor (sigma-70 family)